MFAAFYAETWGKGGRVEGGKGGAGRMYHQGVNAVPKEDYQEMYYILLHDQSMRDYAHQPASTRSKFLLLLRTYYVCSSSNSLYCSLTFRVEYKQEIKFLGFLEQQLIHDMSTTKLCQVLHATSVDNMCVQG